jgi:hypothetical protein
MPKQLIRDASEDWVNGLIATKIEKPQDAWFVAGYHTRPIQKGTLGEISKIQEEVDELADAAAQGVKIMELVELSDLLGAVEKYLERHHEGTTMDDLMAMSAVTRRAFESGSRK